MSTGFAAWISPSDSNVINGLSPLNWVINKDFICASVGGASLQLKFTGTRNVSLLIDPSHIAVKSASRYPIISWSVNDNPFKDFQLSGDTVKVILSSQIPDPVLEMYLKGFSPFENRYKGDTPVNSVKITGFEIDSGGKTAPLELPQKIWMNIGNSIMSGDAALYKENQGRPPNDGWAASNDGRASYGYLLANHFGYRETRMASGGYNWKGGLAGMPKLTDLMDNITSTYSRLDGGVYNPAPDVVLINLGENGSPAESDVTAALEKLRTRVDTSTRIIVMIPVSGKGRKSITNAVQSYKNDSGDRETYLVDLGDIEFATADGQHPNQNGHEKIFQLALPFFKEILPEPAAAVKRSPSGSFYTRVPLTFDLKGRVIPPLMETARCNQRKSGASCLGFDRQKSRILFFRASREKSEIRNQKSE